MKIPREDFDPLVAHADLLILATIKLLAECKAMSKKHNLDADELRKQAVDMALYRNFGASLDLTMLPIGGNA